MKASAWSSVREYLRRPRNAFEYIFLERGETLVYGSTPDMDLLDAISYGFVMEWAVPTKRIALLKERAVVAVDLTLSLGLLLGTVVLSVGTLIQSTTVGLHVILLVFLNVSMVVFVGYYLMKRASSW